MAEEKEKKRYEKPLPALDEESRPFWEATKRHELYVQRCRDCGFVQFQPRAVCVDCLSSNVQWVKCSGRGKIYTFTVTNQNPARGFRDTLPYIIAHVELEEGVKILADVVDCKPEQVKIGMPVEAVFADVTPEVTLVNFRPAR
jgi:uncharacterized OB-fold protein